jgi:hypothetical protein
MLQKMRSLIGTELRTDACVNNEYATRLAILRSQACASSISVTSSRDRTPPF